MRRIEQFHFAEMTEPGRRFDGMELACGIDAAPITAFSHPSADNRNDDENIAPLRRVDEKPHERVQT